MYVQEILISIHARTDAECKASKWIEQNMYLCMIESILALQFWIQHRHFNPFWMPAKY